jgi:hypothetical protein
MAETARTNAAYKAALTEKAPDVAERVEALDAGNAAKEAAKSERKAAEFADMQRAKAFGEQKPADAVKAHPELAGAYAAAAAVQLKAEADGLNHEQRSRVEARVHHNLVSAIERGQTPSVVVREELERKVERQAQAERDATR